MSPQDPINVETKASPDPNAGYDRQLQHQEMVTGKKYEPLPMPTPDKNPFLPLVTMAMEKGQVDQLERLFEMQLKWDAEEQRKSFVAAMADFKAEAGGITIAKSKSVSFKTSTGKTEYDHAELHDITRALVPVMARHGLSHSWTLAQTKEGITVECVISHRNGHSERVSMTAPPDTSGGKNSIQAIGSTKTYLERYTFLAATGMATGGVRDDDGRSYGQTTFEVITEEQADTLRKLIDGYVLNKDRFMDWLRADTGDDDVENIEDLQAENFDRVHDQLLRIKKQKEAEHE